MTQTHPQTPPTILLIDDTASLRRLITRVLESEGYRVVAASTGPMAITVLLGAPSAIDLVISDVEMPEMDGPTTVAQLLGIRPDLPVIYISGSFIDAEAWRPGREMPEPWRLSKPVTIEVLVEAVRLVLERHRKAEP